MPVASKRETKFSKVPTECVGLCLTTSSVKSGSGCNLDLDSGRIPDRMKFPSQLTSGGLVNLINLFDDVSVMCSTLPES